MKKTTKKTNKVIEKTGMAPMMENPGYIEINDKKYFTRRLNMGDTFKIGKILMGGASRAGSIMNINEVNAGSLMIAGLPFSVSGQSDECGGSVGLVINLSNSTGTDIVQADGSLTKLFVLKNTNNQGHTPTNLTNNTYFRCTIQYTTTA